MPTTNRNPWPLVMIGLLTLSATMPIAAAPGDQAVPPRSPASPQPDQPAASALEYLWIAGSSFHPLDSSTTYSYPGSGCIAKTGGSNSAFAHRVVLPQGAVVNYLRLYYYDTSTSTVTAFFTTYDGAGNFNERSNVASVNQAAGYGSALSPLMNFTVDQFSSAINVAVNLGAQNDSTLRFCGVRIAYEPPITDRIFANGFELTPL